MRLLCSLLTLISALPGAVHAGESNHCANDEAVVFSCQVRSGKYVSVCASAPLSASRGYLQYRFGTLGKVELRYPSDTTSTQKQFSFGVTSAPTAEAEHLDFKRGDFVYSVYRRISNDESENSGGVVVSRVSSGEIVASMECYPSGTLPRMSLENVVPEAK